MNALAKHFMIHDGKKVFLAKPEEAIGKTYKMVCGKVAGKVFHDPTIPFDEDAYEEASNKIKDSIVVLGKYQHVGWDSLKRDIIDAVSWGAKAVFIDPITNLTNGINAGDANTALQGFAQDISSMALDYNFAAFIFCHLKSPEGYISEEKRQKFYREGKYTDLGNCPHELGGSVYSNQFAGSRAMMRSCNYMLALEGNKDRDLPLETRNVRNLVILEDREFGESASVPLFWDRETTLFNEVRR